LGFRLLFLCGCAKVLIRDIESPIDEIYAAFDGVERPKELTLHVAEEHDNYDYLNDVMRGAKDYDGRWQDILSEHLLRCHWGCLILGQMVYRTI
jgi:hypothetical protein